jgi:chaperonin GroEL
MKKIIKNGSAARDKLKEGIDKLYEAVSCTLGPGGRNVVIKRVVGDPFLTKDGVTVAKEFVIGDLIEDAGAQMCKAAALRTNDLVGDGTTTATVLTKTIIDSGYKYVSHGGNATQIKLGIELATRDVVEQLKKLAKPVDINDLDALKYVATISGNDPEIGKFVAEAYHTVGKDGAVGLDKSDKDETYLDLIKGYKIDSGYLNKHFATNQVNGSCILDKPKILLVEKRISNPTELLNFLTNYVSVHESTPLVILADDVEGEALQTLVLNKMHNNFSCCAIRIPASNQRDLIMKDIAKFTGARLLTEDTGVLLDQIPMDVLGTCNTIVVSENETTIIGSGVSEADFNSYLEEINGLETKNEQEKKVKEIRLAKLKGAVGIIKLSYLTMAELLEKRDRYEDAINATKAAISEGIVPGGGAALIKAASKVKPNGLEGDVLIGYDILIKSLSSPMEIILKNSGHPSKITPIKIRENSSDKITVDAAKGELVDAYKAGIVDPVKVTRSALETAAMTASLFLTTECVMVEDPDDYLKNT